MTAVVVGYVPRPEGQAALARGIVEAQLREARLVVVNATRGDALVDDGFLQGESLDELDAALASAPVPAELRQLNDGRDIAQQLEAIALETGADLIVIGLRRRSRVGKLIMGSAASRILLSVSIPVLAVKADE
jgi:nucleotide-binding universal stress UspA family protein